MTLTKDAQMPLPLRRGIRKALQRKRKGSERWPLPGGRFGRPCSTCGCHGDCVVTLDDGESTANCIPATSPGYRDCSRCRQQALPGVR